VIRAPLVALLLAAPASAEEVRQSLSAELGAEVDSNVHRVLAGAGGEELGVGVRAGARWALAVRPAVGHALVFGISGAGRALGGGAAGEENTFLAGTELRWDAATGSESRLQLALGYHDLFEADTEVAGLDVDRDFRTGVGRLGLVLTPTDWRFGGGIGARAFGYKPDRDLDFAGITLAFDAARTLHPGEESVLVLGAGYSLAHRDFRGPAREPGCEGRCTVPTALGRTDLFHTASLSAEWQGELIVSGRYELAFNDSNSVGQSFVRHRVDLAATFELARWLLTARLLVQINRGEEDPLAGNVPSIEDESKSAAILHALRPLSGAVALELRAAAYAGPLDGLDDYSRLLMSVGVVYR
jgi:hypothetical protein